MSYEKSGTAPDKIIRFYYDTEEVFKGVQRKSSNKAASITKQDGTNDFIRIELSEDQKDVMKDFMKTGMLWLFNELFSTLKGNSIVHDSSFTPVSPAVEINASYADIADNEKYRTINLDLVDNSVYNGLINYILFEWYSLKGLGEEAKLHYDKYMENKAAVSSLSLALRQL